MIYKYSKNDYSPSKKGKNTGWGKGWVKYPTGPTDRPAKFFKIIDGKEVEVATKKHSRRKNERKN